MIGLFKPKNWNSWFQIHIINDFTQSKDSFEVLPTKKVITVVLINLQTHNGLRLVKVCSECDPRYSLF